MNQSKSKMKVALDRKISGNLKAVSVYYFKSPAVQFRDDIVGKMVDGFINQN